MTFLSTANNFYYYPVLSFPFLSSLSPQTPIPPSPLLSWGWGRQLYLEHEWFPSKPDVKFKIFTSNTCSFYVDSQLWLKQKNSEKSSFSFPNSATEDKIPNLNAPSNTKEQLKLGFTVMLLTFTSV